MAAEKKLPEPKVIDVVEAQPNKEALGKTFKKEAKSIMDSLAALSIEDVEDLEKKLESTGSYELTVGDQKYNLAKDLVSIKRGKNTLHVEEIIPSVIEPSFGIGRIMYAIFEHNFKFRENDEQRTYISLPAAVAPLKCSVLPLSNNVEFQPFVRQLCKYLIFTLFI